MCAGSTGPWPGVGRTLGEVCFCHVTFVWWLLGAEPVDFWFCSEMRARALCRALLLFSLPASRQLCPPLSFLGASPPSVHWNRVSKTPQGPSIPPCALSPAELNQSSRELTPAYPLDILRLSFMHENNILGRDGANLRNPCLVLGLVWGAQGEGSSILIPPTFIPLRDACTDRRAGPGLGRGGMWAPGEPVIQGPNPGSDTAAPAVCDPRQAPPLSRPGFSPSLQWHCCSLLKPLRGLPGEQSVFNLERICLPGVI